MIQTPRMVLRAPAEADRQATLAALKTDDLPNWFEKIVPPITDRDFDRLLAEEAGVHRFTVERREGRAIIGMHALYLDTPSGDYLSYWLIEAARGQGFAAESVNALLDHAFGTLGRRDLQATVHDGNEASHRLVQRLGFERLRACGLKGRPGTLYRMSKSIWKDLKALRDG